MIMRRIKRRNFIKKTLGLAAGATLLPPVFLNKMDTLGKVNLLQPEAKPTPFRWKNDEITIAWIGHASVLINFYGTIIITDPVLYERVGLYFAGLTIGPARYTAPALEFDEIPKPDLVLLSHAHMDHTDYKTLFDLTVKYPGEIDCITAYNTADVTAELEWRSIEELDWGDRYTVHDINIRTLEVQHFGWRFPWEKDRSKGFFTNGRSYNAYILEKNGKKILFGGDTAYSEKFHVAADENIDIAIMPIGAYNPWRRNHCNPEEALIMASEHLKAKHFIPIHCNTFKQGMEPIDEPLTWMNNAAKDYKINIGIKNIGETFTLGMAIGEEKILAD
jgi:L-ascorbate metabolism protein UlaG (beta-lactamase superfamily)